MYTFDSLSYARHLRERGVPAEQAEAHADAARQFIMLELVTKQDLQTSVGNAVALLDAKIEAQTLRLTVRLGAILAAGIALLGAINKLT